MANYKPAYPTGASVDAGIQEFITAFYGVSDTPGKNQEWVDFFRDDATLVMEKKAATGKTGTATVFCSWDLMLQSEATTTH